MSDDPRIDIAQILMDSGYRQMIEIAESMKDYSDDQLGVFNNDTQALGVAEFLFAWANAVLEREEEQSKEAGE